MGGGTVSEASAAAGPGQAPPGTFGPSALLTPANGLTLLRVVATPPLILLIMLWGASWETVAIWLVLSLTDGVDGWVARRQGTTTSGAFLDPLADKVVVIGAMAALVAKRIVWWVPIGIMVVREVSMSVYRSVVGRRGISIPARPSAKVKTSIQDLAIVACLVPTLAHDHHLLAAGMWLAAVLTVVTGLLYAVDGRRASRLGRSGAGLSGGRVGSGGSASGPTIGGGGPGVGGGGPGIGGGGPTGTAYGAATPGQDGER